MHINGILTDILNIALNKRPKEEVEIMIGLWLWEEEKLLMIFLINGPAASWYPNFQIYNTNDHKQSFFLIKQPS